MLKKYRQLIIGIVIGIILASSAVLAEDVIRNSYFNSDLKLAINGQLVKDIRIVTVELEGEQYGRNYYSIADLVKALNDFGGISAKVDFDSNSKTTLVEVEQRTQTVYVPNNSSQNGIKGENEVIEIPLNKYGHPDFRDVPADQRPEIQNDGKYYFFIYNENKYILVSGSPIVPQLKLPEPYRLECPIYDGKIHIGLQLIKHDELGREIIIDDIPYAWYLSTGDYCIPYDYFINTIVPIIEGAE